MSADQLYAFAALVTAIGGVIALFVKTDRLQQTVSDTQAKVSDTQAKVSAVHEQTNGRLDALLAENTQLKAQLAAAPKPAEPA